MPYKDKERRRITQQIYYLTHREELNHSSREYHIRHRAQDIARSQEYRRTHQGQVKAARRTYAARLKSEALEKLGGKCSCPDCNVSEPMFLTIDHINGHSKKGGHNPILEAKASGWDKTKFQILCYNCNCAKKDQGFCPVHKSAAVITYELGLLS